MIVTIPEYVVSAAWGCIATGLGALGVVLFGIKSKNIPLTWGKKSMEANGYITETELSNILHLHCSKRQIELTETLNKISDSIEKVKDSTIDIKERLARLEGRLGNGGNNK